MKQQITT